MMQARGDSLENGAAVSHGSERSEQRRRGGRPSARIRVGHRPHRAALCIDSALASFSPIVKDWKGLSKYKHFEDFGYKVQLSSRNVHSHQLCTKGLNSI